MNILPKKKWHVRTKENMARVRRDEAKAAEEERLREERAKIAENEDRATSTSEAAADVAVDPHGHVNLFAQLEAEERQNLGQGNKEYEAEKKKEQADWESKMGIMKRLAEDSNEYLKQQNWWEKLPIERPTVDRPLLTSDADAHKDLILVPSKPVFPSDIKDAKRKLKKEKKRRKKEEKKLRKREKKKHRHRSPDRKKRKRSRSSSSSSSSSSSEPDEEEKKRRLEKLRAERLQREQAERIRERQLLMPKIEVKTPVPAERERKYNSQFNPEFARR
ncbi:hypothetical protein AAVH_05689 [Aphelenchoides avenae]|nr:hypothetical protein AAVH_05689 [Aphelenchus avenae]